MPQNTYKESDLESIDAAIKSGELLVDFGDRKVRYRNLNELKESRAFVVQMIREANATATGAKKFPHGLCKVQVCKGL